MTDTERILFSIGHGSSAAAMADLLRVLFADASTALDTTYGSGMFWDGTAHVEVTGHDADPARGRDGVADFRDLPYADGSFDVVVFDPPFQSNPGKGRPGVMASRFSAYANVLEMEAAVRAGVREAWRVSRLGIIVKVQNHIHGGEFVHMTRWVEEEIPARLYDEHHVEVRAKLRDRKWNRQLSVWKRHATYMIFRHDGPMHRPRVRREGRRSTETVVSASRDRVEAAEAG